MTPMPRALTIAGSDPSGGAGVQQDLKVFDALGVWGASAVTAVTVQDTTGVRGSHPIPWAIVAAQIEAVVADLGVAVAKSGMLPDAACVRAVADAAAEHGLVLVVDPVIAASDGTALMDPDALGFLRERLLPRAALVTPNAPEAAALTGGSIAGVDDQEKAARALVDMGAGAALVTGGHVDGDAVDVLFDGRNVTILRSERIDAGPVHGTGCVLSAAVCAGLAKGDDLITAVRAAKVFVTGAIRSALTLGSGARIADAAWRFVETTKNAARGRRVDENPL